MSLLSETINQNPQLKETFCLVPNPSEEKSYEVYTKWADGCRKGKVFEVSFSFKSSSSKERSRLKIHDGEATRAFISAAGWDQGMHPDTSLNTILKYWLGIPAGKQPKLTGVPPAP